MLEPLLMSKSVFDGLAPDQQKAVVEVGESLQGFGLAEATKDDDQIAAIYTKAGVKVQDMDAATIGRWRKIAEAEAWKDFADRNAECARFLKLAQTVSAV
jgi:TRAP-type C4-dicarboxylate transport system substrate-binding protein